MTAPASGFFGDTFFDVIQNTINPTGWAGNVALFDNTVSSPDLGVDQGYTTAPWTVTPEVNNSGDYVAGGTALNTPTWTNDTTNKRLVFDEADATMAWGAGFTVAGGVRGALVYCTNAGASNRGICFINFGSDIPVAGTLTITWNTLGIAYWQYA